MWRERPPKTRDGKVARGRATFPPARAAPAVKRRVAPSTSSPPVWRHDPPCEGVDTRCRCRRGLYPIGFGQSVPTRVQCGFPGTTWTTTARTSPSESGALGLLKGRATTCATYARHPLCFHTRVFDSFWEISLWRYLICPRGWPATTHRNIDR